MQKPLKLKKGDTIKIIAPSSPFMATTDIENIEKYFKDKAYKIEFGISSLSKNKYLAGNDQLRANDLNNAFEDKNIKAIICLRGGYGAGRILDKIDYNIIKNNPKIFVGYSDITALHNAINKNSNLITFHGPMAVSDFVKYNANDSFENLISLISKEEEEVLIKNISGNKYSFLFDGETVGELIGGNLSVICSLLGTKFEIETKDKILFLEDVGEQPYAIDRMLNQLRLSGKLFDLKGIILGDWKNCIPKSGFESFTLEDIFIEYFTNLNIPVVINFQAGHCNPMNTLAFGAKYYLDSKNNQVIQRESVVYDDDRE